MRYTLHLASSAEFSKMERGQSKIAPWRFLVSAFGLSYQRYHCFWKICINAVLDLLFVRVVSHRRQDVSICNRVDDMEKILSGIQSRRISGLRPLYSSWGALKIYVYEYKYILMYICTHIHIYIYCSLVCIHTQSQHEWTSTKFLQPKLVDIISQMVGEPRILFVLGLPSLPKGSLQYNQFDIHVQSFRFTHFMQLWLTLPFSYSPFWQLMCFVTETAKTCRIIFLLWHAAHHQFQRCHHLTTHKTRKSFI